MHGYAQHSKQESEWRAQIAGTRTSRPSPQTPQDGVYLFARIRREGRIAVSSEVYYCGKCRRQQQVSQGEKCRICGRTTVSWNTDRESEEAALKRWKYVNGQ
jgi:hypothetical protein